MGVRALTFSGSSSPGERRTELPVESNAAFEKALPVAQRPIACVVAERDLETLRRMDGLIIDRGRKDQRKGIWVVVAGYDKMPLVAADYQKAGRVRQGMQGLLENARTHDERNVYIIGVAPEIFEELWRGDGAPPTASIKRSARSLLISPAIDSKLLSPKCLLAALPHRAVPDELRNERYIGESHVVELVRQYILKAADSDFNVLIIGPTGTGKENVARAVHDFGSRSAQPYVPVNTTAVTSTLFASELFGSTRGAFTDSTRDRIGLWVSAGAGTLLLDEIGDLSLDLQKQILRVLEDKKVRPVGSNKEVPVAARVIASTNRDLFAMVRTGQFRDDLFFRLQEIRIETPPLRDHAEDIPLLARFLWRRHVIKRDDAELEPDILAALQTYRWPGNVRELRAVLIRLYGMFETPTPTVEQLRMVFAFEGQQSVPDTPVASDPDLTLHRAECLRCLRRADEIIQACFVTLRPILQARRPTPDVVAGAHQVLHYRLLELERLLENRLLFHGQRTYALIDRLTRKLAECHRRLERGPGHARRYWQKDVAGDLKRVQTAIFKEVDKLKVK